MQSEILVQAIEKAIRGGATALPCASNQDLDYVRAQTDVAIDANVLKTYLVDLKADPDMAAREGLFANLPFGGGISVDFSQSARLLLAQAIATRDVAGTVARFISHTSSNETPAIAVMAVSGIQVTEPVKLGSDVMLTPMSAVSPSTQRGMALGQNIFSGFAPRIATPTAISTRFTFGPVYYKPKNPQPPEEMSAYVQGEKAHHLLEEAHDLLSLVGAYPHYQMSWAQPEDWLMAGGLSAGWQSTPSPSHPLYETVVPKAETEAIGAEFFALPAADRTKFLRIPLDRLSRAGRERDSADKAIDLGIALEALLLHELGNDRGELSYRLGLRGAWLLGTNASNRADIQKSLRDIYALRSGAVHSGFIESSEKAKTTIDHGMKICADLIRKVISLRCRVDWQAIVLGA